MKGFLLNRGIKVTEHRVRDALKILDPVGVYQRTTQNRAIFRRQYFVEYSNQLWHLDTNMKLIRYIYYLRFQAPGSNAWLFKVEHCGAKLY
jgi:hypothetical protein